MRATTVNVSTVRSASRVVSSIIALLILFQISACTQNEEITIGFVGGLTGRVSDLGGPARNGMLLAIEEVNQQGGINGKTVQTIIKDDKQNAELAIQAVSELISKNVDAIIGPVTSSMAVKVAPLATESETLMMGVTVTTNSLTGIDDYFVRTLSATAIHAGEVADFLYNKKGIRNFSAIYDMKNKAYSQGWVEDFKARMEKLGGRSQNILSFSSNKQEELIPLAKTALENDPDIIIFVTNAVDAALLAKLVRSENSDILLGTSEWAGTERLIQLAGRYIEGAYVPQYLDRESTDPGYTDFRKRFMARFNHEPGFPGLVSYNSTRVVLDQLKNKARTQSLKDAITAQKLFPGIQGQIQFDQYGDAVSNTYITQVQNGHFVVQSH